MSTAAPPEELIRRRRRKRPRRLRSVDLPPDLHPATLAGLYEPSSERGALGGGTSTGTGADGGSGLAMSLLSTEWAERPLPPMSVLATVQTSKSGGGGSGSGTGSGNTATAGPDCPPLLTDFLKSIGVGVGGNADGNNIGAQAKEGGTSGSNFDNDDGKNTTNENVDEAAPAAANNPPPTPASTTSVLPEIEPIDDPNRSTLTAGGSSAAAREDTGERRGQAADR